MSSWRSETALSIEMGKYFLEIGDQRISFSISFTSEEGPSISGSGLKQGLRGRTDSFPVSKKSVVPCFGAEKVLGLTRGSQFLHLSLISPKGASA